jgi:cyclopropane fatty-acyl-phospholipid synthase-like methyltransferase
MQQKWEEHYKSHNYFHLEPHESLPGFVNKCKQGKAQSVLDLGCGAGADILYLAKRGFDVVGVDFSPSAAANAEDLLQAKGFEGKVFIDNLFDKVTNFEKGDFDAIIAINALEYTDINTFEDAMKQISRILEEGGLFLLVVPSEKSQKEKSKDEKSKSELEISEQLFFNEEKITEIVSKRFSILDFYADKKENFVILLEKKNYV